MLGISSLLTLIGLLIVVISAFLLLTRKKRNVAVASFIVGLLLIFLPSALVYLLSG